MVCDSYFRFVSLAVSRESETASSKPLERSYFQAAEPLFLPAARVQPGPLSEIISTTAGATGPVRHFESPLLNHEVITFAPAQTRQRTKTEDD